MFVSNVGYAYNAGCLGAVNLVLKQYRFSTLAAFFLPAWLTKSIYDIEYGIEATNIPTAAFVAATSTLLLDTVPQSKLALGVVVNRIESNLCNAVAKFLVVPDPGFLTTN